MHRLILQVTDPTQIVDHIDGNGLNNVITNLSLGTQKDNANNAKMLRNNSSGESGIFVCNTKRRCRVSWHENNRRCVKYFHFGRRSAMTQEEAFEAAKVFRNEVFARIGNKNGIRPK